VYHSTLGLRVIKKKKRKVRVYFAPQLQRVGAVAETVVSDIEGALAVEGRPGIE